MLDKFVFNGDDHAKAVTKTKRMQNVVFEEDEEALGLHLDTSSGCEDDVGPLDSSTEDLDAAASQRRPVTPPLIFMTQPRKLCFDNADMDLSDEETSSSSSDPRLLVNGCPTGLLLFYKHRIVLFIFISLFKVGFWTF